MSVSRTEGSIGIVNNLASIFSTMEHVHELNIIENYCLMANNIDS